MKDHPENIEQKIAQVEAERQQRLGGMDYTPDPPSKPDSAISDPVFERGGHITRFPHMVDVAKIGGKAEKIISEVAETGEPIFILRAKDIFSIQAVTRYINLLEEYGPEAEKIVWGASEQHAIMKAWQRDHIEQVRYPD